jgi:hypothetical protein
VTDFLQNLHLAVATVATQNGPVATAVATAVATVATKRVRIVPAPAPRLGRTTCCMVVSDFRTRTNTKNKTEGRCLLCGDIHKGGLEVMLGMRDWFINPIHHPCSLLCASAWPMQSRLPSCGYTVVRLSSTLYQMLDRCPVSAGLVRAMISQWVA